MAENNLNNNVDDLILIWLDDTIESSKLNSDTKSLIRQLVKGRLITFSDPDQCVDHILTDSITQKVFFIVSNKLGQNVVPLIYEIPQIQTIYVYCGNRPGAEEWAKPHLNVCGIFTKQDALLRQICDDVTVCDKDEDIPMTIFHREGQEKSVQSINHDNVNFMWYQIILKVLRLTANYCNSKTEMIAESRINYRNNKSEENKINDFEQNYEPSKAFHWYTRDSFVYRLLNKALRTQDIEIIFKFRFFINDLHNQIQDLYLKYLDAHSHSETCLTLYRGQRITMIELESLKNNVNQLISMNSFLSATTKQDVAELFAGKNDQHDPKSSLQSVLFIIDVSDITKDTTPFGFIQNYSCSPDEKEVLFTIGAIFKVKSVTENKVKNIWEVHLQLNKQQNEACQDFFRYMLQQIGPEPGPISLGWFLYRMSDFPKAERYVEFMITQLSSNDREMGNAYNLLGMIYKDLKQLQKSVDCYKKALEIYSRPNFHNSSQVVAIHYNLGLTYLALGDNEKANEHQKQANSILINSSQTNNPLLIAMTDSLKGKIQSAQGDYKCAFESLKASLEKKNRCLPSEHPSIATALNEIGIVQEKMGNDDAALQYFQKALDICLKCLQENHLDLADYYANIGRIHYKREQYPLALEQFYLALKAATDSMRDETDNFSILLTCIAETKRKIK